MLQLHPRIHLVTVAVKADERWIRVVLQRHLHDLLPIFPPHGAQLHDKAPNVCDDMKVLRPTPQSRDGLMHLSPAAKCFLNMRSAMSSTYEDPIREDPLYFVRALHPVASDCRAIAPDDIHGRPC